MQPIRKIIIEVTSYEDNPTAEEMIRELSEILSTEDGRKNFYHNEKLMADKIDVDITVLKIDE
jgi:hypothetical protein